MDYMISQQNQTIYLHLGTYKTATSHLQFVFNHNLTDCDGAFFYPPVGIYGSAHHYLVNRLFPEWEKPRTKAEYNELWDDAVKLIKSSGSPSIIISSETFCTCFPEEIEFFLDKLSDFKIKAIIYLRRQDQYISSLSEQIIKGCHNIPKYHSNLKLAIKDLPKMTRHNYLHMCDTWSSIIGKDNLVVRIFEKGQLYSGDIVADFFYSLFGHLPPDNLQLPEYNLNPRLCRDALEYKMLVNSLPIDYAEKNACLRELFNYSTENDQKTTNLFYDHDLLTLNEKLNIMSLFEETNTTIAKKYLNRNSGKLFYNDIEEKNSIYISYSGLSKHKMKEITEYIFKREPELIEKYALAAQSAECCGDRMKRFKSVLMNKVRNKVLYNMLRAYIRIKGLLNVFRA